MAGGAGKKNPKQFILLDKITRQWIKIGSWTEYPQLTNTVLSGSYLQFHNLIGSHTIVSALLVLNMVQGIWYQILEVTSDLQDSLATCYSTTVISPHVHESCSNDVMSPKWRLSFQGTLSIKRERNKFKLLTTCSRKWQNNWKPINYHEYPISRTKKEDKKEKKKKFLQLSLTKRKREKKMNT